MNDKTSSPNPGEEPGGRPIDGPNIGDSTVVEESIRRPRGSFGRRHWGKLTLLILLGLPLAGLALWTVIGLNYTYSTGDRAGYVQKISRKGWLCKTWEGTLYTDIAKGFRSDSFNFSVRNDSLATLLQELSGKRVAVQYDQHNLVPTNCFGDTEYFVTGVRVLPE